MTKHLFNWVGTQGGLYIENKDNHYGWVIFFRENICKNPKKRFEIFSGVFTSGQILGAKPPEVNTPQKISKHFFWF